MEEELLPADIRAKASIGGKEYAWRQADVAETIRAARSVDLALVGGQVQFRFPDATCESYCLSYDASEQHPGEPWPIYVARSAAEVQARFEQLCAATDFRAVAMEWEFIQQKVQDEEIDPLDYLWFVMYFEQAPALAAQ